MRREQLSPHQCLLTDPGSLIPTEAPPPETTEDHHDNGAGNHDNGAGNHDNGAGNHDNGAR